MGAVGSLLMAMILDDWSMPARCWMAPEMPAPLHRRGHLGRHPAPGRHGPVVQDHRHQQRPHRAHAPDRALPHRGRCRRGPAHDHQGRARTLDEPARSRMSQNFFLDNPDLQLRLEHLDLREVSERKEKGYSESDMYPTAPRSYADAKDNYRIVLDVLGEICGERVAPRAAEADEEGAHYENGEVTYAAATRDAIDALRQAELFGAMLSREYGGLNLPESIYQMMVEMVARAESGLMTVYGLQEIASSLEEYGDPETKARILPRFARADVRAGVRPGQDHRPRDLAAREAGQDPVLGLRIAVLLERRGDLLEAVHGHEPALCPGHHLDHHLVDGFGQVQATVLA